MHHDDNTTADKEVADRLTAIGKMGEHVAAGKAARGDAVDLAQKLVDAARGWCL